MCIRTMEECKYIIWHRLEERKQDFKEMVFQFACQFNAKLMEKAMEELWRPSMQRHHLQWKHDSKFVVICIFVFEEAIYKRNYDCHMLSKV